MKKKLEQTYSNLVKDAESRRLISRRRQRLKFAQDPRGYQVYALYKGRTLLGDVKDSYEDPPTGTRLKVRHFNGEPWPFDPLIHLVEIIGGTL